MKINVFSFTRDRVIYTNNCFNTLQHCKSKYPFDHYVLDNGSIDDTKKYLGNSISRYKGVIIIPTNVGLHIASSIISSIMEPCDLVIKADNDCFFSSSDTILNISSIYGSLMKSNEKYILSPRVLGISKQPKRGDIRELVINDVSFTLGHVGQIGGLCMAIPYNIFKCIKFNTNLPMARGLDSSICSQAVNLGCKLAYIENMTVTHYETTNGQGKRYPEYFKRKRVEETKPYEAIYE